MKRYTGNLVIELEDQNTGNVETVSETNMVTNAVNDILGVNPMGVMYKAGGQYDDSLTWNDALLPICPNMIGGILLFPGSITEQADNIYLPSTNLPVAYASNDVNATANTKRGSMNLTESMKLTDGYKFVWEFTPSQGNGTITAVGLTSKQGGANAYGSEVAVDSTLLQIKKVSLDDGDGFINDLFRTVTVDFENAKLYSLGYASNTVTIKRYRIPVFDIGLNEKLDDSTLVLEDTTVLQCSTFHFYGSYTPYGIFMDGGDGYWYGFANQGNSSGSATVLWIKIKKSDYTFTEGSWTLVADGRHDAIIDEDTWNKAREKRKETGVKWNKIHDLDHEHLLAGILKCPICGASLAGTVRRKKYPSGKVNSTFYYRCLHRKRIESTGKKCDFKPSLNQIDTDAEIIGVIHDMVNDEQFEAFIRGKLDEKVDVSSFEAEREGLRTQLVQATGAKDKLMQQLDRLDVTDRHYDRKYQDMQDRLDTLYDRIADLEEKIDDVTDKISGAYDENLTSKQLCKVLLQFDEMFEEMTDLERKEFLYTLIERIDLFPERQENGSILKRIRFKFRVDYDAEDGGKVLLNENDVETVCLMSRREGK